MTFYFFKKRQKKKKQGTQKHNEAKAKEKTMNQKNVESTVPGIGREAQPDPMSYV